MKKVMSVYLSGYVSSSCCGKTAKSENLKEVPLPSGRIFKTKYGTIMEVNDDDFDYIMSYNKPVEMFKEVK